MDLLKYWYHGDVFEIVPLKASVLVLQQDVHQSLMAKRVYGGPGTDGTYFSNLWFNLKNEHLLLGICFGHPLQKFNGVERLLWLLESLCFQAFMMSLFCKEDGSYEFYESIIVGLVVTPYKMILRIILEAPCLEKYEHHFDKDGKLVVDDEEEKVSYKCCEYMSYCFRSLATVLALLLSLFWLSAAIAQEEVSRSAFDEDEDAVRREWCNTNYPGGNCPVPGEGGAPGERPAASEEFRLYILAFLQAITMSFLVFSPMIWVSLTYFRWNLDKKVFDTKWATNFPNEKIVSYTDVALKLIPSAGSDFKPEMIEYFALPETGTEASAGTGTSGVQLQTI